MRKKKIILPKLHDCQGDTKGRWFVFFSYRDPETNKMKRFKVYEGFSQFKLNQEKRDHAVKLIENLTSKLKSGWSPFDSNDEIIYEEHLASERGFDKPIAKQSDYSTEGYLNQALAIKSPQLRKSSYQSYKSQLRELNRWLRLQEISCLKQFMRDQADEFLLHLIENKCLSNTTRNSYLINLKGLFNALLDKHLITNNPFEGIKLFPESKKGKEAFTASQASLLKKEISLRDQQLLLFIEMMFYCLIRPRELLFLQIENINLEDSRILINGEISKNKKSQYVSIPQVFMPKLLELNLDKYPPEYYLFGKYKEPGKYSPGKNSFYNRHKEILDRLGFSHRYSLYSWKHTGAVLAVKNGINLKELQVQLRHGSLEEVDNYLKSIGVNNMENLRINYPQL